MTAIGIQLTTIVLAVGPDYRSVIIPVVTGDQRPVQNFAFTNSDGSPLNLTGITVRFLLRRAGDTTVINASSSAMTQDSAPGGTAHYTWGATDLVDPGMYEAEIVLDYGGGVTQTMPDLIQYQARLRY